MDYRLSVFLAVAEHGSLTKAARALHLSQPAVTKHVRLLEEAMGRPLFDRSAQGVRPTRAGALLLDHARQVARLDREVLDRIRGNKGAPSGKLALGATSTVGQYLLPAWLVEARRAWPELRLSVRDGNTEEIVEAALEGKIDLGLIEGRCCRAGLAAEEFLEDEIVCVASPRHPAAQGRPLAAAALGRQTWIFREKGSGTRDAVETALRREGIETRRWAIDLELGSSEAIKAVVAAGHGLSFLSRVAVAREVARDALRVVPVRGLSVVRQFSFIYPRGPRPEPRSGAGAFLGLVLRSTGRLPRAKGEAITSSYDI
ncbi:MAG TPA: LysR family transcriptional regulator [Candidatus Methylacidiphilales bacterium]